MRAAKSGHSAENGTILEKLEHQLDYMLVQAVLWPAVIAVTARKRVLKLSILAATDSKSLLVVAFTYQSRRNCVHA